MIKKINGQQIINQQLKTFTDKLIQVDRFDKQIGNITKYDGHRTDIINKGTIHRAFSVFLFNAENKLLLQQRSEYKITYPLLWTNSCCSHPLDNEEERDEINGSVLASRKRVKFELNLDMNNNIKFNFVQKILYKSIQDEQWGEHEVDYIYFVKSNIPHVLQFNTDEINNIQFIGIEDIDNFMKLNNVTPWFKKIYQYKLLSWWNQLIDGKIDQLSNESESVVEL